MSIKIEERIGFNLRNLDLLAYSSSQHIPEADILGKLMDSMTYEEGFSIFSVGLEREAFTNSCF